MNFFTIKRSSKKLILLKTLKPAFLLLFFVQIYFVSVARLPVRSKLAIQLLLNTDPGPHNTADGVVAFYADNFSTTIGNEDSYKMTNLDENLAINCAGTLLSIEGRPAIHHDDTLKLVMWKFRQKSYYLKFSGSSFKPTVKAVVRDNYLHRETAIDLSSATLVPFSITNDSASYASNRFTVVYKTSRAFSLSSAMKMSAAFKENTSVTVAPNPISGNTITLKINNLNKGKYSVSLYSQDGQLVYSGFINYDGTSEMQTIEINKRMHKGTYSLLLTSGQSAITKKVVFE